MKIAERFAQIAVALPIDRLFSYAIPKSLEQTAKIGKRARVPFANRSIIGYIVGLSETSDVEHIKELEGIIDQEPIVSQEMLEISKWIAQEFFCSWGEAIEATIPGGLKKGKTSIKPRKDPLETALLPATAPSQRLALTEEQNAALSRITASLERNEFKVFLLHGITASGKTEVYLQAIDRVLREGKSAIVLVPEISLTPQTQERFISRFGDRVAVIHSRLTQGRRFVEWQRIKEGKADIIVGARSAVLSPVRKLGLVVLDEEHETSYKQEDTPRYHAREVAIMRARYNHCPVILGSATPSLESYYKAKKGEYELLRLTKRIDDRMMPKVKIVDMRMELATRKHVEIFSKVLTDAIEKTLKDGKQTILFLNRRGYSTFVNCRRCGLVMKCKRCDTTLVYHSLEKTLLCHYCNIKVAPPDICPGCSSSYIRYFGLGTEKVESEITRRFPFTHTIARMDSDTTTKRGSHDRILSGFKSGSINLLIGTQMIAKGLDFPEVTLVGVVSADVMLNLPDFRSSERTFNLLTQVAGRAGRGDRSGEVIVQTYAPGHYAILTAAKHDYEKFYEKEIVARRELLLPPFVNIAKVTVRSRTAELAQKAAGDLCEVIARRKTQSMKVVGPAPSPVSKIRGYYRWNILLKAKERGELCSVLKEALAHFRKPSKVFVAVDIDPVSM